MKTIRDVNVKNKVVLVRVDFNVPIEDGAITSDLRVRACLPTLDYLREHGAKKIILISHLGRPEGRDKTLSLKLVAELLDRLIGNVAFVSDVSGPDVESAVRKVKNGGILVLENLRFYAGEEKNSEDFICEIIDNTKAQIFVQDGFAVVHRAHASTSAIAKHLPVYAGLLLEKEITNLEKVMRRPEHPFVLIIGGAKVDDKQPLVDRFGRVADKIIVGGKIAADGYSTKLGNVYVAEDFDEDAEGNKFDVGPVAMTKIAEMLKDAKMVIWNGLMGKAEDPAYATASTIVAKILGEKRDCVTIVCGGDTAGFVENLMKQDEGLEYTLVSTGGGAALEFLAGNSLPGLEVVEE